MGNRFNAGLDIEAVVVTAFDAILMVLSAGFRQGKRWDRKAEIRA